MNKNCVVRYLEWPNSGSNAFYIDERLSGKMPDKHITDISDEVSSLATLMAAPLRPIFESKG